MKRTLLIGTIVILVLALTGGAIAIAYASWDKKDDTIDLESSSVASNVNVKATYSNTSKSDKNLIPSIATIRTAKDAERICVGDVTVNISSDDKNAAVADLLAKIDATYEITQVYIGKKNAQGTGTALANGSKTWKDYVTIDVCSDTAGNTKMANNKLTLGSTADTKFYVFIKFNDFSKITDTNEQNYIKGLSGKTFTIDMKVKIDNKADTPAA